MTPATRPAQTNPTWGVNVSRARNGNQRFPSLMLPRRWQPGGRRGARSGRDRLPQVAPHRLGKEVPLLVVFQATNLGSPSTLARMALEAPRNVFDIWFSPFTNFLRNWDYKPVTSWFEHFITINWNSQDADVEQHVLGEVGSYGLQLSRILDAVDLLVSELDLARLTPEQQRIVVRLEDLRDAAHRSVNEFRGRTEPKRRRPPARCSRGSSPPADGLHNSVSQ